jgi:hypothetical protein
MHATIKAAIEERERATAGLRCVLATAQAECSHGRVVQSPWRASDWGSPFRARRLCLDCGLEEEAKNSGWGDSDTDFKRLKTGGFHKVVSSEELYRSRFPESEVDC